MIYKKSTQFLIWVGGGLSFYFPALILGSAPCLMRSSTNSRFPAITQMPKGGTPNLFRALGSTPFFRSSLAISKVTAFPWDVRQWWSGVYPATSWMFDTSAPSSNNFFRIFMCSIPALPWSLSVLYRYSLPGTRDLAPIIAWNTAPTQRRVSRISSFFFSSSSFKLDRKQNMNL